MILLGIVAFYQEHYLYSTWSSMYLYFFMLFNHVLCVVITTCLKFNKGKSACLDLIEKSEL